VTVTLTELPFGSQIYDSLVGCDFADCYQFEDLWPDKDALQTYLYLVARTPKWMNALMAMRNQVVRLVGLKHLGYLAAPTTNRLSESYCVGERLGIFSLLETKPNEVILFDDDKHLRVQLSLFKLTVDGKRRVALSTVVHIHNGLGRVYMAIVGPVHSMIAPRMLAQITHA
jgi:hypothetical protein